MRQGSVLVLRKHICGGWSRSGDNRPDMLWLRVARAGQPIASCHPEDRHVRGVVQGRQAPAAVAGRGLSCLSR